VQGPAWRAKRSFTATGHLAKSHAQNNPITMLGRGNHIRSLATVYRPSRSVKRKQASSIELLTENNRCTKQFEQGVD
jgi:hypothetical protein